MLDTTYIRQSHNTNIRIDQQPHDAADAARLHGEIKKKAEDEIVQAIRIEGNTFNTVVHVAKDCVSGGTILNAIYDINGKRVTTEHFEARDYRGDNDHTTAALTGLIEAMSKRIAAEILWPALKPHFDNRTL